METYSPKLGEISNDWYVLDADGVSLGRLAAFVAQRLRGKYKPTFSGNLNAGDNIIVINLSKSSISPKKLKNNFMYSHSGYPGGLKKRSWGEVLNSHVSEKLFRYIIRGMMPKGALGRQQLKQLYVYSGGEHPHAAQNPVKIDFGEMNIKLVNVKKLGLLFLWYLFGGIMR